MSVIVRSKFQHTANEADHGLGIYRIKVYALQLYICLRPSISKLRGHGFATIIVQVYRPYSRQRTCNILSDLATLYPTKGAIGRSVSSIHGLLMDALEYL